MSTRRAVILIPVASFLVTFAPVWPAGRPAPGSGFRVAPPPPAVIVATGVESRWQFRYPGLDGVAGTADDIPCRGDLHVPLHTALELVLRSEDYIYTFSAPELGLRGMAVPDLKSTVPVCADRPGTFRLDTDLMCGRPTPHAPLRLVVEPLPEFQAWLGSIRP